MAITVNSRNVDFVEGETISKLMKRMNFVFPLVVVKLNSTVIPRSKFTETKIPDDAVVEIMHLISGG